MYGIKSTCKSIEYNTCNSIVTQLTGSLGELHDIECHSKSYSVISQSQRYIQQHYLNMVGDIHVLKTLVDPQVCR